LDERIASHWQGAQLDVVGSGAPAPGGTTTMFFHKGSWAAMIYWKTKDAWCVARTYTWSVTKVTSESAFSLDYQVVDSFPSCVPDEGPQLEWAATGSHVVGASTVYDGHYAVPAVFDASRTVCSNDWADKAPCGFPAAAAALPTPPAT
jgi:hypothetical protein